jgi:RNA polymerase sigma-70 factor (ECF subfamily)
MNDDTPVPSAESGMKPPDDFRTFMRNYQNMVFSTSMRLLADAGAAEDISQEVFLKAHARWDELQTSPTAGGWLRTVATNLSLNHLRRYRSRWRFFSEMRSATDDSDGPEVQFPAEDQLFEALGQDERRTRLQAELERLPSHQRVPLVLHHFEELPYEEIARRLGVSVPKIKTDLHRGRAALAKALVRGGAGRETFQS